MPRGQPSRVGLKQSTLMAWVVAMHGTDDATLVADLGQFWEQLADVEAALTVAVEPERRAHQNSVRVRELQAVGNRLAGVFREHRLGIEGVYLRGTTVQIKVDDALGLCGKVRRLGLERSGSAAR